MPITKDSPLHYVRYRLENDIISLLLKYNIGVDDAQRIFDNCIAAYKDNLK